MSALFRVPAVKRSAASMKILAVAAFLLLCGIPLAAQQQQNSGAPPPVAQGAFPQGATRGNAEMPPLGRIEQSRIAVSPINVPLIDLQVRQPENGREVAFSIQLLLLLTILSLAPSILLLATCFLRFSIVLDFIKRALSLQQVPPTTVLNGIAFFMTLFVMWPVFTDIYDNAYRPLAAGEIALGPAFSQAEAPLRLFMYKQMAGDTNTISLFMNMGNLAQPQTLADVPTYVLMPAYILHELTRAFQIGILLYIPFIIIDMVVASVLMSMGMMMLPPMQISMPFKLILFVLIDGWGLLTSQLFNSIVR